MKSGSLVRQKYRAILIASLLGWIIATAGEFVDSVVAGIYLGEDAVSAVGLVSPVYSLMYFFACVVAAGGSTLYSRYAGAFETEKSYKIAGMSVLLAVAIGVVLLVVMRVMEDAYFVYYAASPEVEALAREYYWCFGLISIVFPLYWVVYYLVSTDGDEKLILIVDVVTAVGNVILSVVLVQKMGIKGIGLGTVFSTLITIVFLIAHFFKKNNSIHFKLHFSFGELKEMALLGTTSLNMLYVAIVDIVINKVVIVEFGDKYLAAYAVVNLVLNTASCFSCTTDAAGPFIGVAYGEKNLVSFKYIMKLCNRSAFFLACGFVVAAEVLAVYVPSILGITDPQVAADSIMTCRILGLSYFITAYVFEWAGYLTKINKILPANIISLIYMLITPIAFVVPLSKIGGYLGLVIGFFLTPFAAALYYYIYVAVKYGKKTFPIIGFDTTYRTYAHGINVNEKEILELRDCIGEDLKNEGISQSIINQAELLVEETMLIIKDKNPGKKIAADCTLLIDDNEVRMITRDNGVIFDMTNTNMAVNSLNAYVAARVMESTEESAYLTTISFNRNSYLWKLNEANA